MDDDAVILGEEPEPERSGITVSGWWLGALGVATATVILLSSGPPAPESLPGPSTTTTTTTTAPSVPIPPAYPTGEVVDQTLSWDAAIGLEDAPHIGGVVEFNDAYWMVRSSAQGVTAWTSTDSGGVRWEVASQLDGTEGWVVPDVEVADGRLVVAAAPL